MNQIAVIRDNEDYISKIRSTYISFNDGSFNKEIGMLPLKRFWLRSLFKVITLFRVVC
jgi:hypothetical protein